MEGRGNGKISGEKMKNQLKNVLLSIEQEPRESWPLIFIY